MRSAIFFFAAIGAVIAEAGVQIEGSGVVIMSAFAAVVFTLLAMIYFRLLGRLMWYTQTAGKKVEAQ